MSLSVQIVWLLVLAVPIACITWTVTHEEIFREPREYCERKSQTAPTLAKRKFFFLFTCEFCFSHYVAILFLIVTRYHLLYPDWRGYLVSLFALVWIANLYIALFARAKLGVTKERYEIKDIEQEVEAKEQEQPKAA